MISARSSSEEGAGAAIWGICLAGGKSGRMGTDKAMLRLPDGRTFLDQSFSLLASVAKPVFVSRGRCHEYPDYPAIVDDLEECGPAGGIAACLKKAAENGASGILALACDLPAMTREPLARLLRAHAASSSLLTCFFRPETGKMQMSAAVWATAALPYFTEALRQGAYGLYGIVPRKSALLLDLPPVWLPCFHNCNTPEDLRLLETRKKGNPSD